MKDVVTKFNLTGECEIDISEVIKQWNLRWDISQWKDEYTLCRNNRKANNFTKTDIKVRISTQDAHRLIAQLKLVQTRSPIFKSGSSWSKAV